MNPLQWFILTFMAEALTIEDLRVDIGQIKKNILELATIGRSEEDRGIYRMAFTDKDMEGKRWLLDRIDEAGLESASDGAANIFGKIRSENTADDAPAILMGSHIDTVPCAGALDGSLGVVVALECLRTVRESGVELRRPLEMVAFSDEEGRFGGMFGSQAFCGLITPDTFHNKDLDGIELGDAMLKQGLAIPREADGAAVAHKQRAANQLLHLLYLHGNRRWRTAKPVSCGGEIARLGDGDERAQQIKLQQGAWLRGAGDVHGWLSNFLKETIKTIRLSET